MITSHTHTPLRGRTGLSSRSGSCGQHDTPSRSARMLPSEAPGSEVVEGQGDVQPACASGVSSSQWTSTRGDLPPTPRTLGFAHRYKHKWGAGTASSGQRPEMLLHVQQGIGWSPRHHWAEARPSWADHNLSTHCNRQWEVMQHLGPSLSDPVSNLV